LEYPCIAIDWDRGTDEVIELVVLVPEDNPFNTMVDEYSVIPYARPVDPCGP
jgi:hypothetical protein